MTMEIFLSLLLLVSVVTSLVVEGIKTILNEHNMAYAPNTIAGIVAAVLAVATMSGYAVLNHLTWGLELVVYLVALILLSWLAAMLGYDKVIQAITQIKMKGE